MSERQYPPFDFRIGRVTKAPVEDETRNGKTVVKFPISVNQSYEKEDNYWLDVTVFSERARKAALALSKGDRAAVEGTYKETEGRGDKVFRDFTAMSVYEAVEPQPEDDDDL